MLKRSLFAAILVTAIPMSAQAGEFNYNYIEVGMDQTRYGHGDANYGEGDSIRSDGNLSGSFGFADKFYVSGIYRKADTSAEGNFQNDVFRIEEDFKYWTLNFGYHLSVSENNDLIAEIGRESNSSNSSFFFNGVLFDGFRQENRYQQAAVALRTSYGSHFESLAKIAYKDNGAEEIESRLTAELGGMYKFNPVWALTLNTQFNSSGISSGGLGVRYQFGGK